MSKIKLLGQRNATRTHIPVADFFRKFWRDEEGGIVVLTLLLIVTMLIMGGMAVDFMRFESRRITLQSVADRAVLAAANLDRTVPPETVVNDYFQKAGLGDTIVGAPEISPPSDTSRTVGVTAALDLNTFYLRLAGIDTLVAPAQSTAIQGVGEVEISLVLDVSGSMYIEVPTPGFRPIGAPPLPTTNGKLRRIDLLEDAAVSFVQRMLENNDNSQVSISLVTYSAHVAIGEDIYKALNVNQTIDGLAPAGTLGEGPNPGYCVELDDAEFLTTEFSATKTYDQTQTFQTNAWGYGGFTTNGTWVPNERDRSRPELDQPLCLLDNEYQIIPISRDETRLTNAIRDLQATGSTSIFMGLKWGVTLLDPSFRDVVANMDAGTIDNAFITDPRPADYMGPDTDSQTVKYIVLMTDGENTSTRRLQSVRYDEESEVDMFANYNLSHMRWAADLYNDDNDAYPQYQMFADFETGTNQLFGGSNNYKYTGTSGDNLMDSMCDAAKDQGIIIFSIALGTELPADGTIPENAMSKCASEPKSEFYFATEGDALESIFNRIADQITALRLSL